MGCIYCGHIDPTCGVRHHGGYKCTRPLGHAEEHVACGLSHPAYRWSAEAGAAPSPAYLRELRDRAAVAVLASLFPSYEDEVAVAESVRISTALVAALYPEEVGHE